MFRRINISRLFVIVPVALMIFASVFCGKVVNDPVWLDSLHEKGRQEFYNTIVQEIETHSQKSELAQQEIDKIREAEVRYDKLYELLLNIFYLKDEAGFRRMLNESGDASIKEFEEKYLELARFSAHQFVNAFFKTTEADEWIKKNTENYKDLDAVDLVIRTTGYLTKNDPGVPQKRELSPEFDKQSALDVGRFREAHKITKGKGAKIAILDTGIDPTHPIFANTKWGSHFSIIARQGKPWESDASMVDWGWHGTLITSVAARYAPEAQITVYKFGDGDTMNDPAYQYIMECIIGASIYKAVNDGNDIISISAGGATLDVDYLRDAIEYAYKKNVVIISANPYSKWYSHGWTTNYPGQYETVISVTAAEKKEDGLYGYWPVCASYPSTNIAAANDIFGAFPTYVDEVDDYIPSISAVIPSVAALAAMTISVYPRTGTEVPGEYADIITKLILDNASPEMVGFKGHSEECGSGLMDAKKTIDAAVELNKQRH